MLVTAVESCAAIESPKTPLGPFVHKGNLFVVPVPVAAPILVVINPVRVATLIFLKGFPVVEISVMGNKSPDATVDIIG